MQLGTYTRLTVLLGVAAAAVGWLGVAGWLAVVVLLASIGLHVAGNFVGTRLRDQTDGAIRRRRSRGDRALEPVPVPTAVPSRLERRESLGRTVPVSATVGAICGGAMGTTALVMATRASPAGAVFGGVSSAVIGALFGFLAAGFVEVVRTGLREAIEAEERAAGEARPSTTPPRGSAG